MKPLEMSTETLKNLDKKSRQAFIKAGSKNFYFAIGWTF